MKIKRSLLISIAVIAFAASACRPAAAKIDKGPYLQNVKKTEITICWESSKALPSRITYAPLNSSGAFETVALAPEKFYEVTLSGLEPGAQYRYSVWQNDTVQGKGVFRTAPDGIVPFRFIAYGDTRSQSDVHAAVIKQMSKYGGEFVVATGDLVAKGSKQSDWNDFWRIVSPYANNIPIYPILGNHEQNADLYFKYFSLPLNGKNEKYYAFAYSNVFVLGLDSSSADFLMNEQKSWVKKALARGQSYDYIVVFFHHPFYSSSKREPNLNFRKIYEPIFREYGVSLVLNGHDHFYERSISGDGITYVIAGGGGAPLYGFERNNPESLVRNSTYHFVVFDVNSEKMAARVIDKDGIILDEFSIDARKDKKTISE